MPPINGLYYFLITDGLGCISDTSFININNIPSSTLEVNNSKSLIKIIDVLGRKNKESQESLLFYIYEDGTVEKRIILE